MAPALQAPLLKPTRTPTGELTPSLVAPTCPLCKAYPLPYPASPCTPPHPPHRRCPFSHPEPSPSGATRKPAWESSCGCTTDRARRPAGRSQPLFKRRDRTASARVQVGTTQFERPPQLRCWSTDACAAAGAWAVAARPFVSSFVHGGMRRGATGVGTLLNEPCPPGEPSTEPTPVFALRYSRTARGGRLLATADESGCVSLVDTTRRLPQRHRGGVIPHQPTHPSPAARRAHTSAVVVH
jgi:hypothetical protein